MARSRTAWRRLLADPAVDGVVLTHGTDTLEETAFLLDLTLDAAKPVVFCGAMRTVSEPGWDGPANLLAAVRTAVHPDAPGRGVLVVVGEDIHSAAEATKWHAQACQAFRSPHGPLGTVERGRRPLPPAAVRAPRASPRRGSCPRSTCTRWRPASTTRSCAASLARGARGLVLEATGCGNVPPAVVPGIRAALAAGVPVLLVSRCAEGRVVPAYGYDGGGRMLRDLGVILCGEMPGPKARILLMVALGATSDPAELRALVTERSNGS